MKLLPCELSEPVAASLSVAMGSDFSIITEQIKTGICQLWRFSCHEETLGYAVTRSEVNELVVVCYEGKNVDAFADLIVRVCRYKNISNARFHTTRPGLNKLLKRFNPTPIEYVMRIKCDG